MARSSVSPEALQEQLKRTEDQARTLERVLHTRFPVAQTPKEIIWTLNKARLYRYVPVVPPEQRHPIPLLLVFALINRPYILDLRPGSSFVEYMLEKGYDVYLIDWGSPGPEDKNLKLDDYVLDYLPRAIRKLKSVSGSQEYSLLGWCIGAILTTLHASLHDDDGLRNLILLTAPLDFSNKQCGGFSSWVDERYFDVDRLVEAFGNMPAEMIDYGAKALKPVENYIGNYLRLWDNLDNPRIVESWHAMNTWVNDVIPMAGAAFRQLIVELYRENRLMEGTMRVRGRDVDVRNIRASFLNMIAESDHIVPPPESETMIDRIGSEDKQQVRIPGGHIGMMAGSTAIKGAWPTIDAWLGARSETDART
jgi:polyhydroxyalkanoate synthase